MCVCKSERVRERERAREVSSEWQPESSATRVVQLSTMAHDCLRAAALSHVMAQ